MLTFEQIKELIELVANRGLGRFELERSGFSLKIAGRTADEARENVTRPPAAGATAVAAPVAADAGAAVAAETAGPAPVGTAAPAAPAPASAPGTASAAPAAAAGAHVQKSPIVGTFYAAPSPDADPYVKIGDRVERGQVLCIVEAMKLMNEIEADIDGVILEIHPQNAQPVEYGEPLFAIQPS